MADMIFEQSYSLENIKAAAARFLETAQGYRVLAFSGTPGAGKTTFVHALCEVLGVEDSVSSPTFALINEYHYSNAASGKDETIYHMDWYRLKSSEEAINAGMEDCLRQQGVHCFVEWPEQAEDLLPPPYLRIHINSINDTTREMQVYLHE